MSLLANGYCTVCGEYVKETVHVCPYSLRNDPAPCVAPSEPTKLDQILKALHEVTRILREIEYHVRTR